MKKSIQNWLGVPLIAAFALASCDNDILVEQPTTFLTPEALLVDEEGAETYLLGAYDAVQPIVSSGGQRKLESGGNQGLDGWANHWGTIGADEVVVPPWAGDRKLIYLHQLVPSTAIVRDIWENLYVALNRINSVVDRVGAMDDQAIDPQVRARIVAEAKVLRTMVNFSLVTTWENIVLLKNETKDLNEIEQPQSPPEDVYAFMIEDLRSAAAVLDEGQGSGRVTKGFAQAFLGKVYLQMTGFPLNQTDKFALAENVLKEVMDSGVYDLVSYYPDIFTVDNEQNNEMVYAIGMDGPGVGEGGLLSTFYGPNGSVNEGGGWGTCFINHTFTDTYEEEDIRYLNNVARHNANDWSPEEGLNNPEARTVGMNTWRGWKWHAAKPNQYPNDTPFDNPYIRYADVLLMYAEALNGQGKLDQAAIDLTVNRLRARARMSPGAVPDMEVASQREMAEEILNERRKELCLEGWRRNDLIRAGNYEERISGFTQEGPNAGNPGPEFQDFEIRWPIPLSELEINSQLNQNPGY